MFKTEQKFLLNQSLSIKKIEEAKLKVKDTFRNCGVNHCTVEIESEGTICPNSCC